MHQPCRRTWVRRLAGGMLGLMAMSAVAGAQGGATITGRVTESNGKPLFGANVYIQEMNISVGTAENGTYRIVVPAERTRGQAAMLRVRSVGYKPQSKQITLAAGSLTQDFALEVDVNKLSEVVVTGVTGATQRRNLSFTVDQVNAATDLPVPGANPLSQLAGKVTGANIRPTSGRPGADAAIVLRGPKSLNAAGRSQQPLIIVDNTIFEGSMTDLNPEDIERIEVVKGAAASSLYGSRAANGVIQINTKSARSGRGGTRFNVRTEAGFDNIANDFPNAKFHNMVMDERNERFCIVQTGLPACSRTVNFEEEALRINENAQEVALTPVSFERDIGIASSTSKANLRGVFQTNVWPVRYNPSRRVFTSGAFNTASADVTARINNTGVFASLQSLLQDGAVKYLQGFSRNTGRLNVDHALNDQWTGQLNTFYSSSNRGPDAGWFRTTRIPAGVDPLRRDKLGRLFIRSNPMNQGGQNENPIYGNQNIDNPTLNERFTASNTVRFAPASWMDYEANIAIDRRNNRGYALQDRGYRATLNTVTNGIDGNAPVGQGAIADGQTQDNAVNAAVQGTARKSNFVLDGLDARINARYTYEQQDQDVRGGSGSVLATPGLISLNNATQNFAVGSTSQSIRAIGGLTGADFEYKGRYFLTGLVRRDGSSLFGENNRWATYYRASGAWRLSDEGWFPGKGVVSDLKLRSAIGTAGGRPRFTGQYETFNIGANGALTPAGLGNKDLRPEYTTEIESAVDAELWGKVGLNLTYAHSITEDQILPVPPSFSTGFATQQKNAGTLMNKTWEMSVNMPVISTRDLTWNSRVSWDRTRTRLTQLDVPAFDDVVGNNRFRYYTGARVGDVWGRKFVMSCGDLPAAFASQCGAGQAFQQNSDGFIVWVGQGNTPADGITKNLWQSTLVGCVNNTTGAIISATGRVACQAAGGRVNNPYGIPSITWGMPIVMRDSTGAADLKILGNTLPNYRLSFTQDVTYKKLTLFALLDVSRGNVVYNQEYHWSLGDYNVEVQDQAGKSVADAKPVGYYWRSTAPESGAGVGGWYDVLGSNSINTQKASFAKLRELTVGYQLGKLLGVGDFRFSAICRNCVTITDYLGYDPEVGTGGGSLNNAALQAVANFGYPLTRTFTFSLSSRF